MRHRKAITADTKKRHAKVTKKEKTIILDQFIAITKYNRTYAARAFLHHSDQGSL